MPHFLLVLGLLAINSSAQASIYKWTDEHGVTHYSQHPPVGQQSTQMTDIGAAPEPIADDIHETVARIEVQITLPNGRPFIGDMLVTHYRPLGTGPFPIVVISHGRLSKTRHDPARIRLLSQARYWTRRGFAVIVPTRLGYGDTADRLDPEWHGSCADPNFQPGMDAMGEQVVKAAAFGASLPWTDPQRIVLSGASYGGFATLSAGGRNIPGHIASINFSGGLGGDVEKRPNAPCQADRITAQARAVGSQTRAPTLWIYADNDRYWGSEWPRRWHAAFSQAGGKSRYIAFPLIGEDGHRLIYDGFAQWRPVVDSFLVELGFSIPRARSHLPAANYARLDELHKVPIRASAQSGGYADFLKSDIPRAFAIAPNGAWAWHNGSDAAEMALATCRTHAKTACRLYAVDDRVVWSP